MKKNYDKYFFWKGLKKKVKALILRWIYQFGAKVDLVKEFCKLYFTDTGTRYRYKLRAEEQ